jgi:hypothetical protein
MANFPGSRQQARRVKLTTLSPGVKAMAGIGWIVVVGAWVALLVATAGAKNVGSSVVIIVAFFAVITSLPLTFGVLEALRFAAWLDGTTLVVRHGSGTRRCDLGRSAVGLSRGGRQLTARDAATRQRVRLPLARLHPRALSALADSILGGGRRDTDAQRVAAALRAQAGTLPRGRRG